MFLLVKESGVRALGDQEVAHSIYDKDLGRCHTRGVCTLHGGLCGARQRFSLGEGSSWEDFKKEVTWELGWG